MRVDEAGGITVPGLSVAQFGPDQFLTFGDPEGGYGQVGYSSALGVLGVGLNLGTTPTGLAVDPSTGDVLIQTGMEGNFILYCVGQSMLGSGSCNLVINPLMGTVSIHASDSGPSITLVRGDGTINIHGNINLSGTLGAHRIAANERLDCTGAILRIPQAAPTTPQAGDMYVDTENSRLYVYDGTAWKYATLT
jgi:hypothetical protein